MSIEMQKTLELHPPSTTNRSGSTKKVSSAHIKSISQAEHQKKVRFTTRTLGGSILLPRFAPVTKNDLLFFSGISQRKIWLQSADSKEQIIPILPIFERHDTINIGTKKLKLHFSEIDSAAKYQSYLELERFHYRSCPSLIEQEEDRETRVGGRKMVLMVSTNIGKSTHNLGYIELTMPLMMVGPRHRAFSKMFKHTEKDIAWAEWTQNSLKENLNRIVRIARVVTHPTFRGIGLSKKLISVAEEFARERWHIQRKSPIFMEISAEMLNYFDFVSVAGFTYCGKSDGNMTRVARDMRSMSQGQKINSGIMTLQNKYFGVLQNYAESESISIEKAISKVEEIANTENPEEIVGNESWLLLRKIFRLPRPYFVKGLDQDSEKYLRGIDKPTTRITITQPRKISTKINISNLVITADIDLSPSKNVKIIKDAFGLDGEKIKQRLLSIDKFSAVSGNVFLLAGASGTGKSIFIDALGSEDYPLPRNIKISSDVFSVPKTAKFTDIEPNEILIDYFSNKYGLMESLKTLASVGLSEAIPLVKPFWMQSKGQKYRAQLADLILRNAPIWLLDEFGADLDPITAAVVASKLSRLAKKLGIIAIVAAANNTHFYKELRPTRVLLFDFGLTPRQLTTMEYKDELL